jgi:hypothetical protein
MLGMSRIENSPRHPPIQGREGVMNKAKSKVTKRLGILNRWGQLWTTDTFDTETEAAEHLKNFWSSPGFKGGYEPKHFPIVPVRVTVTPLHTKDTLHA